MLTFLFRPCNKNSPPVAIHERNEICLNFDYEIYNKIKSNNKILFDVITEILDKTMSYLNAI